MIEEVINNANNPIFIQSKYDKRMRPINSKQIVNISSITNYGINNLLKLKYINKNDIDGLIRLTTDKFFLKGKDIFFPLRGVLFGEFHGPDLYTIISILGSFIPLILGMGLVLHLMKQASVPLVIEQTAH